MPFGWSTGAVVKVLDLLCALDHSFEGWFGSEDDFQSQLARGLVQCPLCGSAEVRKALSAPRLNLHGGSAHEPRDGPATVPEPRAAEPAQPHAPAHALQAAWLQLARQVLAHTEDVGERFATEARRMHHGDVQKRGIRGQATAQETAQLLDEGIAVFPLLLPDAAKNPLQ